LGEAVHFGSVAGILHEPIFGNVDQSGNRIIKVAYVEVPKKAGKTEWVAGIALLCLVLDKNPGCQIYGAAATRQAMNVFRAAAKMVEQSAELSKILRVMRGTNRIVKRGDKDSFYAAIAADGDFSDGVNPAVVIADELHRWRTRKAIENWDVLRLGGIARKQTLAIAITTAGVQSESPIAWQMHEKARKIEEKVVADPTFFGQIYGAQPEDDWTDERTWIRANPSLKENGGFLELSKIREQYQSCLTNPDEIIAFKRYYLNLWDQKQSRAIDMPQWHACRREWTAAGLLAEPTPETGVRSLPDELLRRFVGRPCWIGVDLSMTTDLSAVSCVFPSNDRGYDVLPFAFLPADGVRKRELQDGMPYRRWVSEGWIETNPGGLIDHPLIEARIRWALRLFEVREICFDRFNSREMSAKFVNEGIPCKEIDQRCSGLNEATKKFLALVTSGKLGHGGHPVMAHHASCLSLKSDGNDLVRPIKPDREKESSRIDLVAATVNALARAIIAEQQNPSMYDDPAKCAI
jgi:phage terminase large subunit-like protein